MTVYINIEKIFYIIQYSLVYVGVFTILKIFFIVFNFFKVLILYWNITN